MYNRSLKKHYSAIQICIYYWLLFAPALCEDTITIIHILILTEFGLSFASIFFVILHPSLFSELYVFPRKLVYIQDDSNDLQLLIKSHNMSVFWIRLRFTYWIFFIWSIIFRVSLARVLRKKSQVYMIFLWYPGEEPLRFRTDLLELKRFRREFTESIFSSAYLLETLKVLPLDTGSVKNLFLERAPFAVSVNSNHLLPRELLIIWRNKWTHLNCVIYTI